MTHRCSSPQCLSLALIIAALSLAPSLAFACPTGIIDCAGVCCPADVQTCFNGTCNTLGNCSTIVCGSVCCPEGVTTCFDGACDTAGVGSTCATLPCGMGCCTAAEPVCCGNDTCAATESACSSGSSGCAIASLRGPADRSVSWFAIPGGLLAFAAMRAMRRRRGQ